MIPPFIMSRILMMSSLMDKNMNNEFGYSDWLRKIRSIASKEAEYTQDCCKKCEDLRIFDLFSLKFRNEISLLEELFRGYPSKMPDLLNLASFCERKDEQNRHTDNKNFLLTSIMLPPDNENQEGENLDIKPDIFVPTVPGNYESINISSDEDELGGLLLPTPLKAEFDMKKFRKFSTSSRIQDVSEDSGINSFRSANNSIPEKKINNSWKAVKNPVAEKKSEPLKDQQEAKTQKGPTNASVPQEKRAPGVGNAPSKKPEPSNDKTKAQNHHMQTRPVKLLPKPSGPELSKDETKGQEKRPVIDSVPEKKTESQQKQPIDNSNKDKDAEKVEKKHKIIGKGIRWSAEEDGRLALLVSIYKKNLIMHKQEVLHGFRDPPRTWAAIMMRVNKIKNVACKIPKVETDAEDKLLKDCDFDTSDNEINQDVDEATAKLFDIEILKEINIKLGLDAFRKIKIEEPSENTKSLDKNPESKNVSSEAQSKKPGKEVQSKKPDNELKKPEVQNSQKNILQQFVFQAVNPNNAIQTQKVPNDANLMKDKMIEDVKKRTSGKQIPKFLVQLRQNPESKQEGSKVEDPKGPQKSDNTKTKPKSPKEPKRFVFPDRKRRASKPASQQKNFLCPKTGQILQDNAGLNHAGKTPVKMDKNGNAELTLSDYNQLQDEILKNMAGFPHTDNKQKQPSLEKSKPQSDDLDFQNFVKGLDQPEKLKPETTKTAFEIKRKADNKLSDETLLKNNKKVKQQEATTLTKTGYTFYGTKTTTPPSVQQDFNKNNIGKLDQYTIVNGKRILLQYDPVEKTMTQKSIDNLMSTHSKEIPDGAKQEKSKEPVFAVKNYPGFKPYQSRLVTINKVGSQNSTAKPQLPKYIWKKSQETPKK